KFRIRGQASGLRPQASEKPPVEPSEPRPEVRGPRPIHDDFASMQEIVLRRYRRLLEHGEPFPDLILIDGGKGQLTAAYAALRDVGLDRLVAVGIAKQEELLFTRDRVEGMWVPGEHPALLLIQGIRDDAT